MDSLFTGAQQVAIAELVSFGQALGESRNPVTVQIAALLFERAACIITGDAAPLYFDDAQIAAFTESWGLDNFAGPKGADDADLPEER